jgi:hypothetical protein
MPRYSGKPVKSSRTTQGTNSARSSTYAAALRHRCSELGVQLGFVPQLIPNFAQYFSPLKMANLPLIEHYLYPVSTAPTIRTIKGK